MTCPARACRPADEPTPRELRRFTAGCLVLATIAGCCLNGPLPAERLLRTEFRIETVAR